MKVVGVAALAVVVVSAIGVGVWSELIIVLGWLS